MANEAALPVAYVMRSDAAVPSCDMSSEAAVPSAGASPAQPQTQAGGVVASAWAAPWWACGARVDVREARAWLTLTALSGLSNCLRFALPFLDLVFLGHLSTPALAAASLASVWTSMTSLWLWNGQEEALSTLVAQAAGAGNRRLAGAWLQLACGVAAAASLPIAAAWWWSAPVLAGLGFGPPALTEAAQLFARYYCTALLPLGLFSAASAWLTASGAAAPPIAAGVAQVLASVAANWLLIFGAGGWPGLGFIGSPLSTGIVATAGLLALVAIVAGMRLGAPRGCGSARIHWDLVLNRRLIYIYLEQALPNFVGQALEILQLQILAGLAVHLGEDALAAHNALVNFFMLASCFMFGAVRGTSVRVGACLGADRIDLAKQTAVLSLAGLGALGITSGAVVALARAPLARIFTDDPAVVGQIEPLLPLAAGCLVGFSLEFVCIGVLIGQGRVVAVMAAVLAGNWLVCIPLAFALTRGLGWGLMGIWLALVVGYSTVTVITLVLVLRSNWPRVRDEAVERSRSEGSGGSSSGALLASAGDEHAEAAARAGGEGVASPLLLKQ